MTRSVASTRIQRIPLHAAARVEVDHVGGEVLQLGEPLEAGVAGADEDVRQVLAARARRVLERLGDLERADDAVAQRDRLGQRLERRCACSARPGIGSVRLTEPSATISWS